MLMLSSRQDQPHEVTSVPRLNDGSITVHLYSQGGVTASQVNSFVFGEAPSGADRVEIRPGGFQAHVKSGLYLVGLPDRDLQPSALVWTFLDAFGRVIAEGSGIRG